MHDARLGQNLAIVCNSCQNSGACHCPALNPDGHGKDEKESSAVSTASAQSLSQRHSANHFWRLNCMVFSLFRFKSGLAQGSVRDFHFFGVSDSKYQSSF